MPLWLDEASESEESRRSDNCGLLRDELRRTAGKSGPGKTVLSDKVVFDLPNSGGLPEDFLVFKGTESEEDSLLTFCILLLKTKN